MIVKTKIALYHSNDVNDEEYWDVAQTANKYEITITDTGKKDWGGENIYEVEGTPLKLNNFAEDFCDAESIRELEVA